MHAGNEGSTPSGSKRRSGSCGGALPWYGRESGFDSHDRLHAGVVKRNDARPPLSKRGFDSLRPHPAGQAKQVRRRLPKSETASSSLATSIGPMVKRKGTRLQPGSCRFNSDSGLHASIVQRTGHWASTPGIEVRVLVGAPAVGRDGSPDRRGDRTRAAGPASPRNAHQPEKLEDLVRA